MSHPTKYSYFSDDEILRLVRQYNYHIDRDMVIELTRRLHLAKEALDDVELGAVDLGRTSAGLTN